MDLNKLAEEVDLSKLVGGVVEVGTNVGETIINALTSQVGLN